MRSSKEDVEYEAHTVNIRAGETRQQDFPSPTGKIPCLIDPRSETSESPITVFESGAILLYLSEKYKELLPSDNLAQRFQAIEWMMWGSTSVSSQFKMLGFYYKYCVHKLDYCVQRYSNECRRLLFVLENQLSHGRHWVIGDAYTIADLAIWPWIHAIHVTYDNILTVVFDSMREFPNVERWYLRCLARPAIQRALQVTPFFE